VYLSLIPEALIASMLEPEDFGAYYAIGKTLSVFGEAIFFEVDPDYRPDTFPFHLADERCVPHPDGAPKSSVYLAIHDVLSRIPVSALRSLYLVTDDGRTLKLDRGEYTGDDHPRLHLYQEHCPISPLVASRLDARAFCRSITDPQHPVHVPRIVFSELTLGELADNPATGNADDLPYNAIRHLRTVLMDFADNDKDSKLVLKQVKQGVMYRTVESGFFVGDHTDLAFYPFPTREQLEHEYYDWWRSAQTSHFD
jgi:hypothetical protein